MGSPERVPSGMREWDRAGRSLRKSALNTRVGDSQQQEFKQETHMAEQGQAGQTKGQEINTQTVGN